MKLMLKRKWLQILLLLAIVVAAYKILPEVVENQTSFSIISDEETRKNLSLTSGTFQPKSLSKEIEELFLPIQVRRIVCKHSGGRATVYCAIIPKEYRPELCVANDINNTVELATDIAKRKHATICINAGIFNMNTNEANGYLIVDGQLVHDKPFSNIYTEDYLYMDKDGLLQSFPVVGTLEELVALKPQWAVLGFQSIIIDGTYSAKGRDPRNYQPRTFIGQDYDGNYLIGVCSGRMTNEVGLSYRNIYSFAKAIGFEPRILYNLDGGGSSAFVYEGVRLNKLTQGENRPCPNFLIVGDQVDTPNQDTLQHKTTSESWKTND